MPDAIWYCTRQRAGPLVKECRALRPRLSKDDDPYTTAEKKSLQKRMRSAVCHGPVDRLELMLALFGALLFGAVGAADDLIRLRRRQPLGLRPGARLLLEAGDMRENESELNRAVNFHHLFLLVK